jgi:hypothetical protein
MEKDLQIHRHRKVEEDDEEEEDKRQGNWRRRIREELIKTSLLNVWTGLPNKAIIQNNKDAGHVIMLQGRIYFLKNPSCYVTNSQPPPPPAGNKSQFISSQINNYIHIIRILQKIIKFYLSA